MSEIIAGIRIPDSKLAREATELYIWDRAGSEN